MESKEPITETTKEITVPQPKKGGRPRKYATPEEAKEANRLKNIEGYYKKNNITREIIRKNNKYATIEEAEEAKRQKSLEYYYKNKEKCIENGKKYKQKQRDLLKQEVTTN